MKVSSRFIEDKGFPFHVINEKSRGEKKGGGKPPIWEMVFWWTRKPLIAARCAVAGSVLPASTSVEEFAEITGLNAKSPHRENPRVPPELAEKLKGMSLLDPFAGFGSIPLEAIRLGIGRVVAVELLPTAYVFLKAVLEYPVKWGKEKTKIPVEEARELGLVRSKRKTGYLEVPLLVYDVAKWGKWITEKLREDPDIRELYGGDVAVYIGTWEVKCPVCGRYTPLVGNWWLARTKNTYAYMKPVVENDRVEVEVVESKHGAPAPNVRGRPERAKCLLCSTEITRAYVENGRAVVVPKDAKVKDKNVEFYPKLAIRDWNEKLELYLAGSIELEELINALARPRLLVRVKIAEKDKKKTLVFQPATREDNQKLWRALEKLRQIWRDPDIPTEEIPEYEGRSIWVVTYGFDKFFKLFNPRQLLTLVKLVKLIREAGRQVEEEKLKQGWDKQKAHKYAEAVTTYLAIALAKQADYNSVVIAWNPSTGFGSTLALLHAGHTLSFRGIAMTWNFVEYNFVHERVGYIKFVSMVTDGLRYLVNAVSGSSSCVEVVLDDATSLSRLGDERFDLIVTDPPYRDDVPYAELSDFYYVWLKRVLREYHPEVFKHSTQWQAFAVREVSYSEGRLKHFLGEATTDYYLSLMRDAFLSMRKRLKDDGVLVVFFAHSSPEAWRDLVDAAWGAAGLALASAYPVATESEERVTARGKTALKTSILTVWKPRPGGVGRLREVVEEARRAVREHVASLDFGGVDLFFAAFVKALSLFTSYDAVEKASGVYLSTEDAVREAMRIAAEEIVGEESSRLTPVSVAYALIRKMYGGRGEPIVLSSNEVILLSYAVSGGEKLHKLLLDNRLVEPVSQASKGSRVAKQKMYRLLYPECTAINVEDCVKPEVVKAVAGRRGIDLVKLVVLHKGVSEKAVDFSNAVDVLHVLEYYSLQTLDRFASAYNALVEKYPALVEEAVSLARALSSKHDPEGLICSRVINMLGKLGVS